MSLLQAMWPFRKTNKKVKAQLAKLHLIEALATLVTTAEAAISAGCTKLTCERARELVARGNHAASMLEELIDHAPRFKTLKSIKWMRIRYQRLQQNQVFNAKLRKFELKNH